MAARQTARTRAKDSDRDATCKLLDSAFSEGQLSMPEHRHRVEVALRATTLGDLDQLTADLQVTGAPTRPGPPKKPNRRMLVAVAGAAVVAVAGIGWLVSGGSEDPVPDAHPPIAEAPAAPVPQPVAQPPVSRPAEPPPQVLKLPRHMNTVQDMNGLLEEIRKRFGSTTGYQLAFTPDNAFLLLPDPADAEQMLLYTYRGGWGEPSSRPRSEDNDQLTDLSAFDVAAAVAAWQAAPQTLGIAPGDVEDTHLDLDHISDPGGGPGALELQIRVSTSAGADGYVYLDPAGNVLRVENPS